MNADYTHNVSAAARAIGMKRERLQYHISRGRAVTRQDGAIDIAGTKAALARYIDPETSINGAQNGSVSAGGDEGPPLWKAKTETERVRAERMRFDLAVLRGEYVRAQELYELLSPFWTQAAAHGKSMSARIAAQWCAAKTVAEAKALIDAEIRIFLRLLAGGDVQP